MPKAIAFTGERRVELVELPTPALKPRHLLVRTEFSGVSQGTELWALTGKRRELTFPTVPGYQSVGIIEAVPDDLVGYQVGQRILYHRALPPTDWPDTWMGGHTALGLVPVDNDPPPRPVPDGLDPVAAALAAMPAVSLRGVNMLPVSLGDVAVVYGQGLIGQAAAQLMRLRGAMVIAVDTNEQRLELSRQYAAEQTVNPGDRKVSDVLATLAPDGADIVIDTTGVAKLFSQFVDLLRVDGHLLLQGWYPQPISFDFHDTHLKRPRIAISCGIGDTQAILKLMATDKLVWRPLVSHLVPVNDAPAVYQSMLDGDRSIMGVVFEWSER
jgi:2-desacetyl-2-hydroxyethyl bacteriochlorophyllide A dehydrogenase